MAKASKDIYAVYCKLSKNPASYRVFKDVISKFNEGIVDYIIDGGVFVMWYNLSTISITRRKRDPRTKLINWGDSNKLKQEILDSGKKLFDKETGEGEEWLVYYTNDSYLRWRWYKEKCRIQNKSVYRFDSTRGVNGSRAKLLEAMAKVDLAYLDFKKHEDRIPK